MKGVGQRASAYASAALLAVLTLSVFATAQNRGPVSVVTRFHEAVGARDPQDVQRLLTLPVSSPMSTGLVRGVQALRQEARSVRTTLAGQDGRQARVTVVYELGSGVYVLQYGLVKPGAQWLIDPQTTMALMQGGPGEPLSGLNR